MNAVSKVGLVAGAALGCVLILVGEAAARAAGAGRGGFGGGGHPSMGNVGMGGGRSMGGFSGGGHMGGGNFGGGGRASAGHANGNRPTMGNASRPSGGQRPGGGSFSPSGGRYSELPRSGGSATARPSVHPPSNLQAAHRPSPGGGVGGGAGAGNRPGGGDRPSFAGAGRPGGAGERPGIGGNRPGAGERPATAGQRPGAGNRPEIGNRPNAGQRSNIAANRPTIGSGNRTTNINSNRTANFNGGGNFAGNHPNWDRGNYSGWGLGGGWAGNWHNNCINRHYGWYNGCWPHYWGGGWYSPLAWGAVGWGLGSLTSGWGYGSGYYNPYYASSVGGSPYDYSQPVVVNNYYGAGDASGPAPSDVAQQPPAESPEAQQGLDVFDDGLAKFKAGNYQQALESFNAALTERPNDPVVHEVRALDLFALGDYQQAGAALDSLLSSAPGMDWTTMSSLYGNADDYTAQLRKLEQYCREHNNDAAAYFVLGYQYLTLGSKDDAIKALQVVVENQPKDVTAKRMLEALAPPASPAPKSAAPSAIAAAPTPAPAGGPETDLVGAWRATAAGTTVDLTVGADSQFSWKAAQQGKSPLELKGQLTAEADSLTLESKDQGAMSGAVKSLGPNKWQFALAGARPATRALLSAASRSSVPCAGTSGRR